MLASIHPLGERARRNRWGLTVAAYVIGSTAGGAALGATLGGLGQLADVVAHAGPLVTACLVAAVSGAGLLLDLGVTRRRLPTIHRQVDEDWLGRYRGWVYGLGFGFQLGTGVVTIVTTASVYVTFVLAALSQSALGGLAIGATFGLSRAMLIPVVRRVTEPGGLRQLHRRFQAAAPLAQGLALAVQGVALLVGVGAALATGGSWPG